MKEQKVLNKKKQSKDRLTSIRRSVLNCLADGKHSHSIKDIINHLQKNDIKVNVSSVYNTINYLVSKKIVTAFVNPNNNSINYELINGSDLHFHLFNISTNVKKNIILPDKFKEQLYEYLNENNYVCIDLKVELIVKNKLK